MSEATNNAVGFYIMRVDSPDMAVVTRTRRLVRAEDNKENIPPSGNVGSPAAWRRRQRMKRSPLPHWHPRTPLRDITVIYNALQRRRLREEAATRANRGTDTSPTTNPTVPDESTPTQNPGCNTVYRSPPAVTQLVSTPCTTTAYFDAGAEEIERKLTKSIDQIEKMVNKAYNLNAKKNLKAETSTRINLQKRTLMSMR